MWYARTAASVGAGLIVGFGCAGCAFFAGTPSLPMQARAVPGTAPPSNLRIPVGSVALADAREIPLVPLPVPPVGQPTQPAQLTDNKPTPGGPKPTKWDQPPTAPAPPIAPAETSPAVKIVPAQAVSQPGGSATTRTTAEPAPLIGSPMRRMQQLAAARYAAIDSYIVRMTRRETVHGKEKPQEVMLCKFRREPWSVYFRWLDGEGQGREVVYVKDHYENKLHTLLAAGDMPLTPAGKRLSLPVDSIFVRNASRHAITEAGIGASIGRLGMLLDAIERGDRRWGTLAELTPQARPEFSMPVPAVEHTIPAGVEQDLPGGGKRTYWMDPDTKLPLLVQTHDDRGKEVEYYYYSHLLYPVKLDDDDFNPDKLWGQGKTGQGGAPR